MSITPRATRRRTPGRCDVVATTASSGASAEFPTRLGIKERNIRVIFALLTLIFGLGIRST